MTLVKNAVDKVLELFCMVLFAGLVLLVVWQVFTRYVLNTPSPYSEQLATYTFVWLVLFGAALVFGENGHMAMDFIKEKFPKHLKMGVEIVIQLLILFFAAFVLAKGGSEAASLTWTQATGSIPIPIGWLYLALPISGVLIVFYSLHSIYQIIAQRRPLDEIPGGVEKEEVN